MDTEITDAILENAQNPAKASSDAGSVEMHSLADQIAADKYLKGSEGVALPNRGIRFTKLVPPGTC